MPDDDILDPNTVPGNARFSAADPVGDCRYAWQSRIPSPSLNFN
jgi:hypothetical protein